MEFIRRMPGAFALALGLFITIIPGSARATALNDGDVATPVGLTYAADNSLGGTLIDNQWVTYNCSGGLSGSIEVEVVRETVAGTLDFYYYISNGAGSLSISQATATSYGVIAGTIDVDYRADSGSGIAPSGVSRSSDGSMAGWSFTGAEVIGAGNDTVLLIVRTNRVNYNSLGSVTVSNSSLSCTASSGTFSPT